MTTDSNRLGHQASHQTSKWIYISLFLIITGGSLFVLPAHELTTPDEKINLQTIFSLLEGQRGAIPGLGGFATKTAIDNREYAQYGLGLPIAASGWCWLGMQIDPSNQPELNRLETAFNTGDAGSPFLRVWISLFNLLLTSAMIVMICFMCRTMGATIRVSMLVTLLLAFCTYCLPHGRTLFTEPLVAFCLVAAVGSLIQWKLGGFAHKWAILAGCFWAYAVLTRIDTLVTVPAAAWLLCVDSSSERFRLRLRISHLIAFAAPWLVVFALILSYNYFRFGLLFSTGYEDQAESIKFATPILVGLQGFLFSPGRSLFVYSPPLIFSILGLVYFWKQDRWFAGGILLIIAGYLGAMSKWQNWAGGYDWGPRHIYQITPFMMLIVASYLKDRPLWDRSAKRIGWAILIVISLWVQFIGLAVDPVLAIRKMLYAWPNEMLSSGLSTHSVLMQFSIYLPQFSAPVQHWNMVLNHGPDLMIFQLNHNPGMLASWILASLGLLLLGVGGLWLKRDEFKN